MNLHKSEASAFVREAIARMEAAPRFLSQEAWDDFANYDGPVVSGDPEGRVPGCNIWPPSPKREKKKTP